MPPGKYDKGIGTNLLDRRGVQRRPRVLTRIDVPYVENSLDVVLHVRVGYRAVPGFFSDANRVVQVVLHKTGR